MPRDLPVVTLQNVVLGDVQGMKVSVSPVRAAIRYTVRDQDDEPQYTGVIVVEMPTALKQDIAAWINADVLPAINAQEDLL